MLHSFFQAMQGRTGFKRGNRHPLDIYFVRCPARVIGPRRLPLSQGESKQVAETAARG
jgi:hypothetical protein